MGREAWGDGPTEESVQRTDNWVTALMWAVAGGVVLGVPFGAALTIITKGNEDFFIRRFPALLGLAVGAFRYYISGLTEEEQRWRRKQFFYGAVTGLAAAAAFIFFGPPR